MISLACLITICLLLFLSLFSYSYLNWKENLFLFVLIFLYVFGRIFRKASKDLSNSLLIFLLIFLLSQFFINHFHPESLRWWFISFPGWITLFVSFFGFLSFVSYQKIQPTNSTPQDLIKKAAPGIIFVSIVMFFLFILNLDEISSQAKLVPDYSIYIIIALGFILFYSVNFFLKYLPLKGSSIILKMAPLGILIFLIVIGGVKISLLYGNYHQALHLRSEEKLWHHILELNQTPQIKFIETRALNDLGKINMEKGNFRQASHYYKKILSFQAFDFEANLTLAEMAFKQKDWKEAHEGYKRAIYLRPKEMSIYSPYIHSCIRVGKIDEAIEFIGQFKEIHQISLKEPEDYIIIGDAFLRKKMVKDSILYLKKGIESMPQNYEAHLLLGKAYLGSGQYNDGCEALEKALKLNPNLPEGYYYLGIGYENIHQDHRAVETFERLTSIDNKNIDGLYHLTKLYAKMGFKNKAIQIDSLIESIATKVIEESDWQGRSGENVYQNGNMHWNGTVSVPIILKEGEAKFILQAMGTSAKGIWPHMVVRLDEDFVGEMDVTYTDLKEYEFIKRVHTGKYNLNITFTNDEIVLDRNGKIIEDRNLFLRRCRIVYKK